jgi:hypothetical protein
MGTQSQDYIDTVVATGLIYGTYITPTPIGGMANMVRTYQLTLTRPSAHSYIIEHKTSTTMKITQTFTGGGGQLR